MHFIRKMCKNYYVVCFVWFHLHQNFSSSIQCLDIRLFIFSTSITECTATHFFDSLSQIKCSGYISFHKFVLTKNTTKIFSYAFICLVLLL